MAEDPGFRLHLDAKEDLTRVKKWCKLNRVPYGRLMNQILKALAVLELFTYDQVATGFTLHVEMPRRVDLDNQETYRAKLNGRVNIGS